MRREPRCLAIVNIKRHAVELLATLADPEALHLSTRMCGAHRQVVLAKIKQLLKDEKPCRVVSTQVVEAGVDIDFPVVLRARGPLDSIIQAAGRCNREGKLPGLGRVLVFRPLEECVPKGYYHTATEISIGFLAAGRTNLNDPVIAEEYYEHLFTSIEPDAQGIQGLREDRDYPDYPEIAKRCRLIKDNTESVIITDYGTPEQRAKVQQWIADLQVPGANKRQLLRNLQPFMVSLMWYKARDNRPLIMRLLPGIGIWRRGFYHDVYGIVLPR
jgi:CRISPR-associated endonuclease/helicase Cas3